MAEEQEEENGVANPSDEGSAVAADGAQTEAANDPPPLPQHLATFVVNDDSFTIALPFGAKTTPIQLTEIWEKEWKVTYASRLKFVGPEGTLNIRNDCVPQAPTAVRLQGLPPILQAMTLELRKHDAKALEQWRVEAEQRKQAEEDARERAMQEQIAAEEHARKNPPPPPEPEAPNPIMEHLAKRRAELAEREGRDPDEDAD